MNKLKKSKSIIVFLYWFSLSFYLFFVKITLLYICSITKKLKIIIFYVQDYVEIMVFINLIMILFCYFKYFNNKNKLNKDTNRVIYNNNNNNNLLIDIK